MNCEFFTPIHFCPQFYSILPYLGKGSGILERMSNKIENYFHLGGMRKIVFEEYNAGKSFLYMEQFKNIPLVEKLIKILSYILIIPVIFMLICRIIIRFILARKYEGSGIRIRKEELKDFFLKNKENFVFPKPHPEGLKKIKELHAIARSGVSYEQLLDRGFSFNPLIFVSIKKMHPELKADASPEEILKQTVKDTQDLGFSYNEFSSSLTFTFFASCQKSSGETISGDTRASNAYKNSLTKAIEQLEKQKDTSPDLLYTTQRLQYLNSFDIEVKGISHSFGLVIRRDYLQSFSDGNVDGNLSLSEF
ncbi:DUF648 domain-containing protein [Candidatus Chlamydia corallus]|uniref:DUF648 domain-containing protein n=1 Tax=Candidatus Chlamydia corallus TaxID=2038470 RepID=UPI000C2FE993|nr:DUF648 domain-containing protein [Candidatus Chlamydia corallus]